MKRDQVVYSISFRPTASSLFIATVSPDLFPSRVLFSMYSSLASPPHSAPASCSLLLLDHVNVPVPRLSYTTTRVAYSLIGCTRDHLNSPSFPTTRWENIGGNQFHLFATDDPQPTPAVIGVVVPSSHYTDIPRRYQAIQEWVGKQAKGLLAIAGLQEEEASAFQHDVAKIRCSPRSKPVNDVRAVHVLEHFLLKRQPGCPTTSPEQSQLNEGKEQLQYYEITCPWGTTFHVYCLEEPMQHWPLLPSTTASGPRNPVVDAVLGLVDLPLQAEVLISPLPSHTSGEHLSEMERSVVPVQYPGHRLP